MLAIYKNIVQMMAFEKILRVGLKWGRSGVESVQPHVVKPFV